MEVLFIADTRPDDRYPTFTHEYIHEYGSDYYSDTMLTLFDVNGNTIDSNDNWDPSVIYAKIKLELDPGYYYLGISRPTSPIEINDYFDYYDLPFPKFGLSYVINKTTSMYGNYSTRAIVEDEFPQLNVVPEPGILALLGIGILGMCLSRRK